MSIKALFEQPQPSFAEHDFENWETSSLPAFSGALPARFFLQVTKLKIILSADPLHQRSCRLRHRLKRYMRKIRFKKLRNREDRLPIFSVFDQSVSQYMKLIEKLMRNACWRLEGVLKGPFWKKSGWWFPKNMTSRIEKAQLSHFSVTSAYHFSNAGEENWWMEYSNTSCEI